MTGLTWTGRRRSGKVSPMTGVAEPEDVLGALVARSVGDLEMDQPAQELMDELVATAAQHHAENPGRVENNLGVLLDGVRREATDRTINEQVVRRALSRLCPGFYPFC